MADGWDRSEFYAIAARLNANGIDEARPPNEDETAGAYLALLYGWVLNACTRAPVLDEPPKRRAKRISVNDHLIDHDAEALLQGKNLDPTKRGVEFTYRRGTF
jgi:hypothetical protein